MSAVAERIAVLGAGGFLGSHIVPALLARRDCIVEAVDVTFDKLPGADGPRLRRHLARIDAPGLLDELTARCDVVLSLTALCTPALYNTEPLAVIDASYTDLVPVVKLCAARRRWLVHLSTCEVYGRVALDGDGTAMTSMDEERSAMVLGPVQKERWSYACAKQLLERVIWAHGRHAGLPFTIIRPFNVIGARMDYIDGVDGQGLPRVLAAFMGALLKDQPLPLVDGGAQRRTFIAVEDFVDGVLAVLARPQACHGQILNLGNPDNDVSIRQLAEAMAAAYVAAVPGSAPVLESVTAEALYGAGYDDARERVPDIDRARRLLGWSPGVRLGAALPAIVADYLRRYGAGLRRDAGAA